MRAYRRLTDVRDSQRREGHDARCNCSPKIHCLSFTFSTLFFVSSCLNLLCIFGLARSGFALASLVRPN